MNEDNAPSIFRDESQKLMAQSDAAAVARATQEIQAALVIAKRSPRDEIRAEQKIIQACKRKSLAEVAEYEYSRGGTRIIGPTIDLLRAIANRWGNLLFGWTETDRKEGQSSIRCFAWDLENNSRSERTFMVRHWRDTQAGGYALNDERDIYELLANNASRRVRACLEEIIDADLVEKAVDQCRRTMREGEQTPLKDRATRMVIAFEEYGVTKEMIEQRLGNSLTAISENQLASLRRVFAALRDGVGKREEYFKPTPAQPKFGEPEPKPESQAPSEPPQTPAPPKEEEPPLKQLRALMAAGKVKDPILLQYCEQTMITDGSIGTLEELQLSQPKVIGLLVRDWPNILARIKAVAAK